MADNAPTTAVNMPNCAQQNSPFMKLPTELRLRIYEFALDDIVDDIVTEAANKNREYQETDTLWSSFPISKVDNPIFVGMLGFLHASRELRRESLDALLAPTRALKNIYSDQHKVTSEAMRTSIRDEYGDPGHVREFLRVRRSRNLEHSHTRYRLQRIRIVFNAVSLVARMSSSQRESVRSKHCRS
jgi:hypothetical protein